MQHLERKSSKWHSKLLIKRQRFRCDVSCGVRFALVFLTNKLCWDLYKWQSPGPWAAASHSGQVHARRLQILQGLISGNNGPMSALCPGRERRQNQQLTVPPITHARHSVSPAPFVQQIYFHLRIDGRTDDAWERMHRCQSCVVLTRARWWQKSKRPTNKSARLSMCASLSHLHKTSSVQIGIIVVISGQKWQWNEKHFPISYCRKLCIFEGTILIKLFGTRL